MGTTKLTTARVVAAPSRTTQKHQLGMVTAMRQRTPRKMLNCRDGPTRGRGCARWSRWSGMHRCTVDLHTCIRGNISKTKIHFSSHYGHYGNYGSYIAL